MNAPFTSDQIVHYYSGWPGKALCKAREVVSSVKASDVTCEHCKALLRPAPVTSNERLLRSLKSSRADAATAAKRRTDDFYLGKAAGLQEAIDLVRGAHETPAVQVAGDSLPVPLWQFEQRANVLLSDEQAKANPDNALIGFICDAVRLARENERLATSPLNGNEVRK